jgi:hypothetical protein
VQRYTATHVRSVLRHGSSWPVIADTPAGPFVVKLRGAAHGTAALVAEVVAASLAEAIDLPVPARALIEFVEMPASDDRRDELLQLLRASVGLNVGFQWLADAREFRAPDVDLLDADLASSIVWLDWLVLNPDRTLRNPNLLMSHGDVWLIDHGSALGFQHNWAAVTEDMPRRPWTAPSHALWTRATRLPEADAAFTPRITREVLRSAMADVPDDFLRPLITSPAPDALARRREAYVAFLWKRLRAPRPVAFSSPAAGTFPIA